MTISVNDILKDIDLVLDLIGKITTNVAAAKDVLATDHIDAAKTKLAARATQLRRRGPRRVLFSRVSF